MHAEPRKGSDSPRHAKFAQATQNVKPPERESSPPRLNLVYAEDHQSAPLRRQGSVIVSMSEVTTTGSLDQYLEPNAASEYFLG